MSPLPTISPKQVALAIGVSESSLKRWCDQGLLPTVKTAGGHRRLTLEGVTEFLRRTGRRPVRPEILGLPANRLASTRSLSAARQDFLAALVASDRERCRRIIYDLHLAQIPLSRIGDEIITPTLACVGEEWSAGKLPIYRERRGLLLCLECVADLRKLYAARRGVGPVAIGGAPEFDPYALPTALVEGVLQQAGWSADSLGIGLPFETMARAIQEQRPKLFWLSVSHIPDEARFVEQYQAFYNSLPTDLTLVVGGRALHESLRRQLRYTVYCDTLQHLEAFLQSEKPVSVQP